jgi:hypothetical protein
VKEEGKKGRRGSPLGELSDESFFGLLADCWRILFLAGIVLRGNCLEKRERRGESVNERDNDMKSGLVEMINSYDRSKKAEQKTMKRKSRV